MSREIDLSFSPYVFVYGTLKRNHGNNRLLRDASFIQEDTTEENFFLANLGCPVAFPDDEGKPVRGEVWLVDSPATLHALDRLENHPRLYYRSPVYLKSGEIAWMYQVDPDLVQDYETLEGCTINEGCYEW